jgi:hypothetical protein
VAAIPRFYRTFARLACASAFAGISLFPAAAALGDEILATKIVQVNGRPVQEVRLGEVPGSNNLRVVVVTNGPTAGTTSLLTAVGTPEQWLDAATLAPTFTATIPSGTVFSLGGGCRRGNQVDFPFINNNRPNVLRFTGGTPTIIPALTFDTTNFDSAECRAAPDGSRTTYLFSNRTANRVFVVVDQGGANDLNVPFVNFSSVKTPFLGGLRPQMSLVANAPRSAVFMWMETNGQTRWREYNTETVNVDFNCLVGTQTPPPAAFTIPRGSRTAGRLVVGDFDGDGQFETAVIDKTPAACAAGPAFTTAGPVAGTGFVWTEPAATVTRNLGITSIIYGRETTWGGSGTPTVAAGPHPNVAGTFAACGYENTERVDGTVSVGVAQTTGLSFAQRLRERFPNAPGIEIMASSYESLGSATGFVCDERGLRQ